MARSRAPRRSARSWPWSPNRRQYASAAAFQPSDSSPTHSRNYVYDIRVSETEISEEQIQAWVAEAEAGYDVAELKRRGRDRPGRGAEPMQVVAVRLSMDEIAALDAIAARNHMSRSEALRQALAQFAA